VGAHDLGTTARHALIGLGTCASMMIPLTLPSVYSRAVCHEPKTNGRSNQQAPTPAKSAAAVG
jgi:hypothetical protein